MRGSKNRLKVANASVITIVFVAVLSSMVASNNGAANAYARARYTTNFEQASSLVNECSGEQDSGIICVNDSPLIQGDKNTVNTPISSQISNPIEEGPQGPPGPPGPKGDTGPAGPDKELQVREVESALGMALPGMQASVAARCDASGEVLTGGGEGTQAPDAAVISHRSSSDPLSWEVTVINQGDFTAFFSAFAECTKLVDAP